MEENKAALNNIEEHLWEIILRDMDSTLDILGEIKRIQDKSKNFFSELIVVRMKKKFHQDNPRPDFLPTNNL
jgi:hypothetical protein